MIVDVYLLDEIELKFVIVENFEIYLEILKVFINEFFEEISEELKVGIVEKFQFIKVVVFEREWIVFKKVEKFLEIVFKKVEIIIGFEIFIKFRGEKIFEEVFMKYVEVIQRDFEKICGIKIKKIEFIGNVEGGVVDFNVIVYGSLESKNCRDIEILERRIFYIVSKNVLIIFRVFEYKFCFKDIRVVFDGEEVRFREIIEKDKKRIDYIDKSKKIWLLVFEDMWLYFSNFVKIVIREIEILGMLVESVYFDIKGRREFEINFFIVVKGEYDKDIVERVVRVVLVCYVCEFFKVIECYILIYIVIVEVICFEGVVFIKFFVKLMLVKVLEILVKKEFFEKEVEKFFQEVGIDEFVFFIEEKKKEVEQMFFKSRIELVIEIFKVRIYVELKFVFCVIFKWLKFNYEVQGFIVYVDIEVSFVKEEVGGFFGVYLGILDEKIKQDVVEIINRVIKEVFSEYSVLIRLRKFNIIFC